MSIIALVFLLIALLMVISAFFPQWNFSGGPVVTPNRLIGLVIGLVVLYIVYLIVVALFGGGLALHAAGTPLLALGGAALGFTSPAVPVDNTGSAPNRTSYTWRYVLNAGLVLLSVLSVAGSVLTQMNVTAAWLGLSDVQWHWALVVFGLANALNAALNHTPLLTNPPTQARLAIESQVDQLRKGV